ncbi:MAG TPA: GYD domain-containing protein [Acidocella sp.]|nr:GYD domain-containing protein [Acidocella sp.]
MSHYMLRWQFSDASAKALVEKPHDRTAVATALIESFGGKLHSYYFSFGEFDGVGIGEMPDNAAAAACALAAAASGGFKHFETTVLMTAKEAEAAMKRAHDTKPPYKPPHT